MSSSGLPTRYSPSTKPSNTSPTVRADTRSGLLFALEPGTALGMGFGMQPALASISSYGKTNEGRSCASCARGIRTSLYSIGLLILWQDERSRASILLRRLLPLNRLQRKVVNTILVMVVVPMLVAGMLASEWVSSNFEARLQRWIEDSSPAGQTWLRAYQNDAVMLGRGLAADPDFVAALDRGGHMGTMKQPGERIAKELNVRILQGYTAQQILLYSSRSIRLT